VRRDASTASTSGIDVDVHDARLRRERAHVSGDSIVEAHPHCEDEVSRLDRAVRMLPAMHPHVAVGERVALVDRTYSEKRPGDGDLRLPREREQLRFGVGDEDAVPDEEHRALRCGDRLGDALQLSRMPVDLRAIPRKRGEHLGVARMRRRGLTHQGVLGDVDVHRAGPAAPRDMERLGDHGGDLISMAHQVVVLRHRQGDARDVDLLEGILAEERGGNVSGDHHHRHRIEHRSADSRDEVRGARP
jgi:hypothetical protein